MAKLCHCGTPAHLQLEQYKLQLPAVTVSAAMLCYLQRIGGSVAREMKHLHGEIVHETIHKFQFCASAAAHWQSLSD
jgi:hypothetical protein